MPTTSSSSTEELKTMLAVITNTLNLMSIQLTEHIKENRDFCRETEQRLRALENWQRQAQSEITSIVVDVNEARTVAYAAKQASTWWNGANSLGAFIAIILGAFGIKQQ